MDKRKRYRLRRPEKVIISRNKWKFDNPEHDAFCKQKNSAKARGIEWRFTLQQWIDFWGKDFYLRGRQAQDLCVARYNDSGPYEIDNVIKATMSDNNRNLI